jgi:hypothetical protein
MSLDASLPSQPNSGLLQRSQSIMRLRHYSLRTQTAYLHWIVRYIRCPSRKQESWLETRVYAGQAADRRS